MSTTGSEKHCRLCLMLSKGGSKACHHLLLKRVEDLKPRDTKPNEWTLTSFLNSKKQIIMESNLSKRKQNILFPKTGDTVLLNWDLSLYCHVLTSYCDLPNLDRLDVENLRKIQNELCHMNDPETTNLELENIFGKVQVIIGRILEKLDDKDLKLQVDTIIKKLEKESLSLDETLKEMRKFYLMEMDIHEKIDHDEKIILEKLEKLDGKCEMIHNKLDQRTSSGIDSDTNKDLVLDFISNSSTGTEKHCRLCLMLSKGGTKACHYLLLKRVEDLKPRDSQPSEWTLTSFLNSKKQMIIKSKLSEKKYNVLFPKTGDTVLSNWDLSLYCHILTSYCDLPNLDRLDIENLRKIQNKLYHMNGAEITNLEFENKFEMLQVIIGRILEKLDDKDLKLEVDTIIKKLEKESLSLNETLKEMRKIYLMEMDFHEKLDHVEEELLEKLEKLDGKCEIINNKLDQRASSGIDIATNKALVPDFYEIDQYTVDEAENLGRQGNMNQTIEEIDETIVAHEKGKDNCGEKEEITEQVNWYNQTIISPASTSTYSKEDCTASGRKGSWHGVRHTEGSGTFDQKKELCINLTEEEKMSRTNIRHVSDSMLYQNDESWDTCIERRSESDAKILLEKKILPSKSELNKASRVFGRTSAIFSNICSKISQHIKENSEDVIDVLPSYKSDSTSIVFIVFLKRTSQFFIFKDYECYKISENEPSADGEHAAVYEWKVETKNQSDGNVFEQLRKCINKNADDLFKRHSNLNVILPSLKRSVGYKSGQHKIIEEPCITLFVTAKGLIPLAEERFKKDIDGFRTDVFGGEFEPYFGGPNEFHEHLKIGLAIQANIGSIGTLGGFIEHPLHGLCGITCAHVIYNDNELKMIKENKPFKMDKLVYQPTAYYNSFGTVVHVVYNEGDDLMSGMEVAVFSIKDRKPKDGSFPKVSNGIEAGFDDDHPLCFNSGDICEKANIKPRTEVYKLGMSSEITRGSFELQGAAVRRRQMQGHCQSFGFYLKDQIVILPIGHDPFAEHGDSGALVLMEGEQDSVAIGIVEGGMHGFVFVTPISDILRAVGCAELKMCQFKTEQKADSTDSGVEMDVSSCYLAPSFSHVHL